MNEMLNAVAASEMTTAATLAALMKKLIALGIMTPADAKEVYEDALLMIEQQQGASHASQDIFAAARELIEQHLRPPKRP